MSNMPQCFSTKVRKAIKTHKCCECRQVINPGENYRFSSGIWDSEPQSFKQCLTCAAIFDVALDINNEHDNCPDEGPSFCNLSDFVINEIDDHKEQIERFNFGNNPFWIKQMERYKT